MKDARFSEKQVLNKLPASRLIYGFLLCTALTPASAFAQQASSNDEAQVQDIVVTAQRRSENLQNVPIAVTAITSERMATQGITGTLALTAIAPSLQINQTSNFGSIYLRGVGSNLADPTSEPSVATYIDGVYISSPQGNFFSFNNIERIEVLKGPQGTLFGRNATGGVIQIVTRDPSHTPSADFSVGYGNYNTISGSFYGTTGLTKTLAVDFAAIYQNQLDGFGRNITLNKDIFRSDNVGFRSKLLWTPADGTKIVLSGDYSRSYNNDSYQYGPGVISPAYGRELYAGPYNSTGNLLTSVNTKSWGGSLRVEQDLGSVKLTSITSRRQLRSNFVLDSDQGPLTIGGSEYFSYARNWSQEFQLSNQNKGNFDWVVGLYYFDNAGGYRPWHSIGGGFFWNAEQTTKAWAGYGQATLRLDSGTSITGGLRWTTEDQAMRSINLTTPANAASFSTNHKKLTWRIAIDQKLTDGVMVYASYNRGFKSGGYNLLDTASLNKVPALQNIPSYNPEVVDAYEVGLKSYLFDRRVRFNLAGFYYNYKDIQLQKTVLVGNLILNAANARIKGVEAELEAAVTHGFTLRAGASVLDTEYRDFLSAPAVTMNGVGSTINASGNDLVAAPKFTGNIGGEYRFELGENAITASVNAVYNDGFFWHPDNRLRQPSYTLLNSTITWDLVGGKYQVRVWGKNLTNARYFRSEAEVQGRGDWTLQAPPRTYGITLLAHLK
ncbi:TonB-dependent receptor [Flavisphingomonas formosensis]|uniref:TonB-dependent receptor n=1 Tax=Flavisphingomonas formosensis TaxID=861534 RepID=UPI0012F8EE3C|nr:TonB-dependent receptor [Sphingomonas formosensis]